MKELLDQIIKMLRDANPAAGVSSFTYEPEAMYPFCCYLNGKVFIEKTLESLVERLAKHDPFEAKRQQLIEAENVVTRLQTELAAAAKEMEAK